MRIVSILVSLLLALTTAAYADVVLLRIDYTPYTVSDFERACKKNNSIALQNSSHESFFELNKSSRLKAAEAMSLGPDRHSKKEIQDRGQHCCL